MDLDKNPNSPVPDSCRNTTYLVYIDDSGDSNNDVLTALAIPVEVWSDHLRHWKEWRTRLARRDSNRVAANVELHAVDLGSNSTTSDNPISLLEPGAKRKISVKAFQILRNTPELRVLTVYAPGPSGAGGLYSELLQFITEFCEWLDSFAIIWFDGVAQGLRLNRRAEHRALPFHRRVLEDPAGVSSDESHLLQMADLLAYSAHHAILNEHGSTGTVRQNTHLREEAYLNVLDAGQVWPGHKDGHGLPVFGHPLGIRGIE